MIIIWRRWGILALVIPVLVGIAADQLAQAAGAGRRASSGYLWLGIALGGVLVTILGQRLNRPQTALVEQFRAHRGGELHHLVENHAFMGIPGGPRPVTLGQARVEAAQLLEAEVADVERRTRNRNTIFFVPMQLVGMLTIAVGLVVAVGHIASR